MKLGVNIDHVATLRQVRRTDVPDPVAAAAIAEMAGAAGITVHLREELTTEECLAVRRCFPAVSRAAGRLARNAAFSSRLSPLPPSAPGLTAQSNSSTDSQLTMLLTPFPAPFFPCIPVALDKYRMKCVQFTAIVIQFDCITDRAKG